MLVGVVKTAKRRITQTMPYGSPNTLVFWRQRSWNQLRLFMCRM